MPDSFGLDAGFDLDFGIPRKRKRRVDSFDAETEASLMSTLGRTALSGVAATGNLLDVPGSMARDVLAGQNPFDQILDPFGSENRTTGRDLLRQTGMISNRDTTGNWWGGLAAEILTDPTTYMTFGGSALTKGGKAFKAAGVLDDAAKIGLKGGRHVGKRLSRMTTTAKEGFDLLDDAGKAAVGEYFTKNNLNLADIADEPLQTLARFEIPFTDIGFNFGSGAISQGIASGLDLAGSALNKNLAVRVGRALFDPSVGGQVGHGAQQIAEEAYRAKWKAERAVKHEHVQLLKQMDEGFAAFEASFGDTAQRAAGQSLQEVEQQLAQFQAKNAAAQAAMDAAQAAGKFDADFTRARDDFMSSGREMDELLAKRDVLRRTSPSSVQPTYEMYDKLVRLTGELGDSADIDSAWKTIQEGGTDLPDAVKAKVKETANSIRRLNQKVHKSIEGKGGRANWITEREAEAGITEGFAHMPRYADQTPKDLADLKAGKILRTTHGGMKGRSEAIRTIPAEIVNRLVSDSTLRGDDAADEILNRFGQYLDPEYKIDDAVMGKQGHAAELAQFVKEHRARPLFNNSTPEDFLKYQMGAQTVDRNLDAMHEIVRRNMDQLPGEGKVTVTRAFQNAGLTEEAVEHWSKQTGYGLSEADNYFVPADVANALVATQRIYQEPEWLKEIGGALDTWNQFWKSAVTVPFPSFHSRNFTSGQFMNVATGLVSNAQEMAEYSGEVLQAMKMVATGSVPREIVEELYVNGVRGTHTRAMDLTVDSINQGLPGELQSAMGALGAFKKIKDEMGPSYFDALPGGKNLRAGLNMAGEVGGRVADKVEFMNRVPLYMYLTRKKGWSAAEAAAKVNELHVDYSQLTGFEKSAMRRLVPFYSFQRRIAPVILSTILERPGGFLSQSIKASADLHNEDPLTPEHVGSTLSIPNPLKNADYEGKSYITGFGLPHEQLLQYVGGPRAVLREAASQLNPIVKAPLEWATGQSFFQSGPGGKGRDIEELDPTLGRIYANVTGAEKPPKSTALEFFSANLPTSRVQTSLRQLTDPRKDIGEKAVNFLTGARITDVDLKAQERVVQNRALDLMKGMGARTFEKPYFPDDLVEEMSPEEAAQADALELLQAVLADRQKKRKKSAGK
jgi:hypothetical protein